MKQIYGRGLRPLPKEDGSVRPPPSFGFTSVSKISKNRNTKGEAAERCRPPFGSGRKPRPYICFKSTQSILFGLYFEYIFDHFGCLRLSFFLFFRNPPESLVLYFLSTFLVFSLGPSKIVDFVYFEYFPGFPEIPVCSRSEQYNTWFSLVCALHAAFNFLASRYERN